MKNQGSRTTHYANRLKRHRSIMGTSFDIYVDRAVTLDETLTNIQTRTLTDVSIVLRDGFEDEQRIKFTERDDIVALRDALDHALTAIENDSTRREANSAMTAS